MSGESSYQPSFGRENAGSYQPTFGRRRPNFLLAGPVAKDPPIVSGNPYQASYDDPQNDQKNVFQNISQQPATRNATEITNPMTAVGPSQDAQSVSVIQRQPGRQSIAGDVGPPSAMPAAAPAAAPAGGFKFKFGAKKASSQSSAEDAPPSQVSELPQSQPPLADRAQVCRARKCCLLEVLSHFSVIRASDSSATHSFFTV